MKNPEYRRFNFWQQWLFYSSLAFAISGFVLMFPVRNPIVDNYERMLAAVLSGSFEFSGETEIFISFIRGPFGATIACSYILLAYLAAFPFKRKERWARNAIVAAFGTWFLLDSAVCIYFGVYFQVYMINIISLLQKALPIFFTWEYFENGKNENTGYLKILT